MVENWLGYLFTGAPAFSPPGNPLRDVPGTSRNSSNPISWRWKIYIWTGCSKINIKPNIIRILVEYILLVRSAFLGLTDILFQIQYLDIGKYFWTLSHTFQMRQYRYGKKLYYDIFSFFLKFAPIGSIIVGLTDNLTNPIYSRLKIYLDSFPCISNKAMPIL